MLAAVVATFLCGFVGQASAFSVHQSKAVTAQEHSAPRYSSHPSFSTNIGYVSCERRRTVVRAGRSVIRMPSSEPMVPWQPPGMEGHQFVPVTQRLYRERIVILGDFLDEEKANNLIATLMYLKNDDPKKQISLYINVPGALMKPTLAVYDTLMSMDCPIMTLNMGLSSGMAAFLCAAGTKGLRFSLPNARYLLQKTGLDDPFQGQAVDIGLRVSDNVADNRRMTAALAKMCGHTIEKMTQDLERDFYLSGFEAVQYGLIDKVLLPSEQEQEVYANAWTGKKQVSGTSNVGFGAFAGAGSKGGFQGGGGGGFGGEPTAKPPATGQ